MSHIINKITAIGIGVTMIGATVMGATAANLNTYPEPFVKDCLFNGQIAVGNSAAAEDIIGAIDIATALATGKDSVVSATGSIVAVQGDSWQVKTSSKMLELGENVDTVTSYITDGDLNALADGTFANSKGSFPYEQSLKFGPMKVALYENDDDKVSDFLKIGNSVNFANYTLDFTKPVESDIDSSGNLKDIRNKRISLLGKEYDIVKATNTSGVELRLMGGSVRDTLEIGQVKKYTIDGKEYEVELAYVGQPSTVQCKFKINGVTTDLLEASDSDTVAGIEIGIKDILPVEAGKVSTDQVEFYLGASKLILKDTNIADTASSDDLKVGDEAMNDVRVIIDGSYTSGGLKIDDLKLIYTADDDFYIGPGDKLSGEMEEPAGLINFDMTYQGLTAESAQDIKLEANGDDSYSLQVNVASGDVDIPLAWNTDTANRVRLGDQNNRLVLNPAVNIAKNQYFILTPAGLSTSSESYVLQYRGADVGSSSTTVTFKNLANGDTIDRTWSGHAATVKLGGIDFTFGNTTIDTVDDFNITVTGPALAATGTYVDLVTDYGAKVRITDANEAIDTDDLTVAIEEVDPTNMLADLMGNKLSFTGFNAGTASDIGSANMDNNITLLQTSDDDTDVGYTNYGTKVTKYDKTSSPDEYTLQWPQSQLSPQVFVTSGAVTAVSNGDPDALVCKVNIPSAKLSSEIANVNAQNIIIIGGPCVNPLAAEVLGVDISFPACAAGFEEGKAMIKAVDLGVGKVAMIVAGYSAADTRRAASVLKNYKSYAMSGDEVQVTGTSMTDIRVETAKKTV